jgi:hypothetical protein
VGGGNLQETVTAAAAAAAPAACTSLPGRQTLPHRATSPCGARAAYNACADSGSHVLNAAHRFLRHPVT